MAQRRGSGRSRAALCVLAALVTAAMACVCVCVGSVSFSLGEVVSALASPFVGAQASDGAAAAIIVGVRLPRVLCVAAAGASLALAGAAMQGLLKNPLADGSTLGVSSAASLGAALALAAGLGAAFLPFAGTAASAIAFALASLVLNLVLAHRLDRSLSTNTIILIGIVLSMMTGALTTLVVTFAGERLRSISFWLMGGFSGVGYEDALALAVTLAAAGAVLVRRSGELNAFAVGEDDARHIGVDVRRVRLSVLVASSVLVGMSVAVGGPVAFVGLVTPHMLRKLVGPDHRVLLPACLFGGASFLLLADLVARCALPPIELPVGAVTSLVGSVAFVIILFRSRKAG